MHEKIYRNSQGQIHCEDGPAIPFGDGCGEWHINGQLHRDDGPALVFKCGFKAWFQRGERHCVTGPAVVRPCCKTHISGVCVATYADLQAFEYWVNGRQFTEDDFYRFVDTTTGEVFIPPGKRLPYD